MNEIPLVSMVIPSFNHAPYVKECISSVINQDYENIELIIIDDGSSDHSIESIQELTDECNKRFARFEFRFRENKGLSSTLNEALEWSKGNYFAAIASDDLLMPNKTSFLVEHIDGTDYSGVFCSAEFIDSRGQTFHVYKYGAKLATFADVFLRKIGIIAPGQLLRMDKIIEVGGYCDELHIEDLYMWLALTEDGSNLLLIDKPLVKYRHHEGNKRDFRRMCSGREELLEKFSSSDLYPRAMAINSFLTSTHFSEISKKEAIRHLMIGIKRYKRSIFSALFFKTLWKVVLYRVY